jgi:hypothetical protein
MSCKTCGRHSIICGGCGECLEHCTCPPMPGPSCNTVKVETSAGPVTAIICTRGRRRQNCKFCSRYSTKLCDFPLAGPKAGKTCDAPMCDRCAVHVGPDKDFCPPHYNYREKQMADARARMGHTLELIPQPIADGWQGKCSCGEWKSMSYFQDFDAPLLDHFGSREEVIADLQKQFEQHAKESGQPVQG